jgi:hypothetical protein
LHPSALHFFDQIIAASVVFGFQPYIGLCMLVLTGVSACSLQDTNAAQQNSCSARATYTPELVTPNQFSLSRNLTYNLLDVLALFISEQLLDVESTRAPGNGDHLPTPLRLHTSTAQSMIIY